jgi:hypothetical protein
MSDIGEYWQEYRKKDQKRKADQLKWNTDIILWAEVEYKFKLVKHNEFHYSLYHPKRGRMDVWPSTGKVAWFQKGKMYGKPIVIDDIEAYLIKHFKN